MRRRALAVLLACASVAACGGRVSQEQVLAEAAADGAAGGSGIAVDGSGTAAGTRTGTGSATPRAASGTAAGTGAAAGDTGSATDVAGGDATGGGSGDPAATAPEGGNGGATDVGVTEDRIVIGNISTLSGPVPGLFRGALVGAQAWAAMVNSQGGIDGRLVEVRSGDDALDSGRNQSQHLELKDQVFAFVGSFSVTDDGAAAVLGGTNIPDVGVPLAPARFEMANNFSPNPVAPGWETGPARYYMSQFGPEPMRKTALFVSAVETARISARRERKVLESLGYEIVYTREVQPNEPNYTGDVIQMRRLGVQTVMWEGQADQIADLVNAMADQGFEVPLLNPGSTSYSEAFLTQAGGAAEGARIDVSHALFLGGDADLPEVALFREWMANVDPEQDVDLFAVYAWSAGRMFEQALRDAGPAVTRDGVLAALATVTSFDANGLLAPSNPAAKQPTSCFIVVRVEGGEFVREQPAQGYDCETGPWQAVED